MPTMTEPDTTENRTEVTHEYHAEAHLLNGRLQRPVEKEIGPHAPVELHNYDGGHRKDFADDISVEGLISFTKGKTRVSGSRALKPENGEKGWVTLATSSIENLNVFEVITADRIVSQVSTDHPYVNGHVPRVTFLGTQFRNFRVSGYPVELTLNLGICGSKPADDRSYLQDLSFLYRVKDQTAAIATAAGLPNDLRDQYHRKLRDIQQLIDTSSAGDTEARNPITCSLVQSIGEIPIPGVQVFGHIIVIPEFGSVALGEVEVGEKMYEGTAHSCVYFTLKNFDFKLGCVGHGTAAAGTTTANGRTHP